MLKLRKILLFGITVFASLNLLYFISKMKGKLSNYEDVVYQLNSSSSINNISQLNHSSILTNSSSIRTKSSSSSLSTPQIYFITVLSYLDRGYLEAFCHVLNSTIVNDIKPVTVISFPVAGWELRKGKWQHIWKLDFLLDFMSQPHIHDDDIIFFFDAKDVYFLDNKNNIIDEFIELNVSILFSAEWMCWPPSNANWPPVPPNHPRYINTGVYIAYVKPLRKLFTDIVDTQKRHLQHVQDDQELIHLFFHKHKYDIAIDSNVKIFQSMYLRNLEDLQLLDHNRIRNIITQTDIKLIHFNGHGSIKKIIHNAQPFFKHSIVNREYILEENYPTATFTAWQKRYLPRNITINELCINATQFESKSWWR